MSIQDEAKAIYWLTCVQRGLGRGIQFFARGKEAQIIGNIRVDGFCADRNPQEKPLFRNFYGCYWHGCPRYFPLNRDKIFQNTKESLDDQLERMRRVSAKIKSLGYELIEKWECDFNQEMKKNQEMRTFLAMNNLLKIKFLDPHNAFSGSRTMDNLDERSLYLFFCKYIKYLIGHLRG